MVQLFSQNGIFKQAFAKAFLKAPQIPNKTLCVGIFSEVTGNYPQIPFFVRQKKKVKVNPNYENGNIVVQKGSREVPNIKEYYMGGSL